MSIMADVYKQIATRDETGGDENVLLLFAADVAVDFCAQGNFSDLGCIPCHDFSPFPAMKATNLHIHEAFER